MIETEENTRKEYRKLLADHDFDTLELELAVPNIFEILKISRMEIRHSNFLAWLLKPNETHRLGKLFLERFLRDLVLSTNIGQKDDIKIDDIQQLDYNDVEIETEIQCTNSEDSKRRIDLLITFNTLIVCIENKFDSKNHSGQLAIYEKWVETKYVQRDKENGTMKKKPLYVYLTPRGEEPKEEKVENSFVPYSYDKIIDLLDIIVKVRGKTLIPEVNQYISDYVTILKRVITKDDSVNELANKVYKGYKKLFDLIEPNKEDNAIYKSHKELFEFVFKNKLDIKKELMPFFIEQIGLNYEIRGPKVVKGGFRFLTEKLKHIIPLEGGRTWATGECFLFEIWFWERGGVFKSVIAESNNAKIQKTLWEAMENESISKVRKSKKKELTGKGYISHLLHEWEWSAEEVTEMGINEDKVMERSKIEWKEIEKIVKKVEDALFEKKDDLLK